MITHPAGFSHLDAHRPPVAGTDPKANKCKIVYNLVLIEAIKYVKLQNKPITLQQIMVNIMKCHSSLIQPKSGNPYQKPY